MLTKCTKKVHDNYQINQLVKRKRKTVWSKKKVLVQRSTKLSWQSCKKKKYQKFTLLYYKSTYLYQQLPVCTKNIHWHQKTPIYKMWTKKQLKSTHVYTTLQHLQYPSLCIFSEFCVSPNLHTFHNFHCK